MKSIFPMKYRLKEFYLACIPICVLFFLYWGVETDFRTSVFYTSVLLAGLVFLIDFVISSIFVLFIAGKKYYIPKGTTEIDIIQKSEDTLRRYGFICKMYNKKLYIYAKNGRKYIVKTEEEKHFFKVIPNYFTIPKMMYCDMIKSIPLIVSPVQNTFMQPFTFSSARYYTPMQRLFLIFLKILGKTLIFGLGIIVTIFAALYFVGILAYYYII